MARFGQPAGWLRDAQETRAAAVRSHKRVRWFCDACQVGGVVAEAGLVGAAHGDASPVCAAGEHAHDMVRTSDAS